MKTLFVTLFLGIGLGTLACGTINMRYEAYFKAETDDYRLNELRYLICDPIVAEFKQRADQKIKLMELVLDAQKRSRDLASHTRELDAQWKSDYYRDLALRICIRFAFTDWELAAGEVEQHTLLLKDFDVLYKVETTPVIQQLETLDDKSWLRSDDGLSLSEMSYAVKLNEEIARILH